MRTGHLSGAHRGGVGVWHLLPGSPVGALWCMVPLSYPCSFLMISSPPLQHNCRQQFRRAGLLIWPRSKRLLNAVHADLPQQTLRLSSMLVRARR